MADVNILGNIDVTGILRDYKAQIDGYYGGDPAIESPAPGVQQKIVDETFPPFKIGYRDSAALPGYARLISCKTSTVGYEIRPGDTIQRDGKTYLTNTYNLTISAKNGDTLRWWGHTIMPNLTTQAIISSVNLPGASNEPPPQFTQMKPGNISFYYTSGAKDPGNLMKGLSVETENAFSITCVLDGSVGEAISYDIDILIMSARMIREGSLVAYPIVQVVVDPVVIVAG